MIELAFIANDVLYLFQFFPHWLPFSERRSKNWNVKKNIQNAVQDPIDVVVQSINRWNARSWTGCSIANDHIVNVQWSTDENEPNETNETKDFKHTLRFWFRYIQVKTECNQQPNEKWFQAPRETHCDIVVHVFRSRPLNEKCGSFGVATLN